MDKFVVRGGNPLLGTIKVSGAKNSALPCMAAAILTEDEVILENIPQVRDIETERKLLSSMGAEVELGYGRAQHRTHIRCAVLSDPVAKYEIVKTMRANGARTCLVSGGFTLFTERVAAAIGFEENRANVLTVEDGKLAGRVEEPILGRRPRAGLFLVLVIVVLAALWFLGRH